MNKMAILKDILTVREFTKLNKYSTFPYPSTEIKNLTVEELDLLSNCIHGMNMVKGSKELIVASCLEILLQRCKDKNISVFD